MNVAFYAVFFVLGLAVGSFLNVCVHRLPRDQSIFLARSRCPSCGEPISWFDNIPLLSYLVLGGRCRSCKNTISPGYPVGEFLAGLVFLYGGYWWVMRNPAEWLNFGVFVFFTLMCVTISRIDFAESIIPNELNYSFLLIGIVLGPFAHFPLSRVNAGALYLPQLYGVFGGMLLGGGLFFGLAILSPLFYGKPALGMGDVKLMAAMGAWLGPKLIFLTMVLGSIIGAIIGTFLMVIQGKSLRTEIPFGPFLCLAGVISLVTGHELIYWYMNLV